MELSRGGAEREPGVDALGLGLRRALKEAERLVLAIEMRRGVRRADQRGGRGPELAQGLIGGDSVLVTLHALTQRALRQMALRFLRIDLDALVHFSERLVAFAAIEQHERERRSLRADRASDRWPLARCGLGRVQLPVETQDPERLT